MTERALELRIRLLEDESALRKLINTYHKRADAFEWEAWAACFTDDAVFVLAGTFGTLHGRQQILEVCKGQMDHIYQVHQHIMVNLDFDIDGGDSAGGTGNLIFTALADAGDQARYYQAGGRYQWKFRRTGQGWRIAEARLDFLWNNGADEDAVFADREARSSEA